MKPVKTKTTNSILKGGENVNDLPVTRGNLKDGTPVVESCWELSLEEIDEVKKSGRVYFLCVGNTHPPILLTSSSIINKEENTDG